MKKLILSAAILLGSLSTFAQETPQEGKTTEKATTTEATAVGTTATAETTTASADATAAAATGYQEIKSEELPVAVTESFAKSFPDAKITKVSMNEKNEYKLDVEVGDKVGSLRADANGKWIN